MKKQVGFTLVELLIAIALGLIIAASATMLFLTGLKSQALQTGQSGLQDDANFGLNFILKDVRLSNLNTVQSGINDTTAYGGMVFSSSTTGGFNNSNLPIDVAETLLSQSNLNLSNAQSVRSDQLTIQFLPQYIWDDKKQQRLLMIDGMAVLTAKVMRLNSPETKVVKWLYNVTFWLLMKMQVTQNLISLWLFTVMQDITR